MGTNYHSRARRTLRWIRTQPWLALTGAATAVGATVIVGATALTASAAGGPGDPVLYKPGDHFTQSLALTAAQKGCLQQHGVSPSVDGHYIVIAENGKGPDVVAIQACGLPTPTMHH